MNVETLKEKLRECLGGDNLFLRDDIKSVLAGLGAYACMILDLRVEQSYRGVTVEVIEYEGGEPVKVIAVIKC